MGQKKINRLQNEYDDLSRRLAKRKRKGDEHAEVMRCLFAEARTAWDEGDGAKAKALSEEGRAEQAKSESHNAEANDLRVRRDETRTKLAMSRRKLAEKQEAREMVRNLVKIAETLGSKTTTRGGSGKRWVGGHESTYKKPDGKINHHSKVHRGGKPRGWNYDPKTGKSDKY